MKSLKYLALCLVAALVTTSCSNDENEPQAPARKGKAVKFEMSIAGVNTRTTTDASTRTTDWKVGDAVGIFVYEEGSLVYTNAKYQYDGTDWKCESNGVVVESGKSYKYYAYYPYQDGITTPTSVALTAAQDQNSENGYDLSDVLAASNENGTTDPDNSLVSLTFKHMYAMVEVSLFGDKVTQDPSAVKLLNVKLGGTLNLETQSVTNSGELTEVTMKYLGLQKEARAYRAVVPAQSITTGTPLVAVYDVDAAGKDFQFTYSKDVPYIKGEYRIMEVKIGEANSGITIPSKNTTIDPWTPSTSLDGTGSYEEIVIPVERLELPIPTNIDVIYTKNWNTDFVTGTESFWFKRDANGSKPLTVTYDNGSVTLASLGANNSTHIGYHYTTQPFEKGFYKLTITGISTAQEGTGKASIGVMISNKDDNKTFQMTTYSDVATSLGTVKTKSFSANDKQESAYIYINFAKCLEGVAVTTPDSAKPEHTWKDATNDDVKNINICLYNYTANTSLKIQSIVIEKYTIPTD